MEDRNFWKLCLNWLFVEAEMTNQGMECGEWWEYWESGGDAENQGRNDWNAGNQGGNVGNGGNQVGNDVNVGNQGGNDGNQGGHAGNRGGNAENITEIEKTKWKFIKFNFFLDEIKKNIELSKNVNSCFMKLET